MKKSLFVAAIIAVVGLLAISCSSTNLETNKTGVSANVGLAAKDFDVVKIVKATSTETHTKSLFGKTVAGQGILYTQLMTEAEKAGADDIINVRVDRREQSSGRTTTFTYEATALAIKYKDARADVAAGGSASNSISAASGSTSKGGLLSRFFNKNN